MLLMDQSIIVNEKNNAPEEAEDILKQKPNNGIWLFSPKFGYFLSPSLTLHNWGDNTDSSFFTKVGKAPVIVDEEKIARGAAQLQLWYFNKGYFKARANYKIDSIHKKENKASVNYTVKTGPRYRVKSYNTYTETESLKPLLSYFSKDQMVLPSQAYDADLLEKERLRLTKIFKEHGYYGFSKNNIGYEVDTFLQGNWVDIKMVIQQHKVINSDTSYFEDHKPYIIKDIYIILKNLDATVTKPLDSLTFDEFHLLFDTLLYKPRYLTDALHFEKGDLYNEQIIKESYSHLIGYKAFSENQIKLIPVDPANDTLNQLVATVNLKPLPKQTTTQELELTFIGNNPGINASVGWVNRNIFGAGEALEIRIKSGIDYNISLTGRDSRFAFEYGGEIGILFPRFLLPFNTYKIIPKRMVPNSKLSLSYSRLARNEFDRTTFGGKLTYNWKESRRKSWRVDLIDMSYSQVINVDKDFRTALSDIQRAAFTSEFISSSRLTYLVNEQLEEKRKSPRYLRTSVETAGNLFKGLDNSMSLGTDLNNGTRGIFDVHYFQYVKFDLDLRHYWNFKKKRTWANRIYGGYILPYGNSLHQTDTGDFRVPPFSKYFYMGGSNDLRGWLAYRLGAGTQPNTNYATGEHLGFSTGTVKMLFSSEYRFPIFGFLYGSVFIDAGNVWLSGGLENEATNLKFNSFIREMAVGSGFGFRMDLDFFILRLDLGLKVRDPALLESNKQWVIATRPWLKNSTLNIALGYPF